LLFWGITQRMSVVGYRLFGTVCRTHLQGSSNPVGYKSQVYISLDCFTLEDVTDRLSRNVGRQLPT